MKNTASSQRHTTEQQAKGSRQNTGSGAAGRSDTRTDDASASQRADSAAKRGKPLSADKQSERAPKQENL